MSSLRSAKPTCSRRWEGGRVGGLRLGLALAEETAAITAGLGLACTLHCEVFLGVLDVLGSTPWHNTVREDALAGRVVGCFSVTETRGGSDIPGTSTIVERTADGWRLLGEKRYTSNIGVATHCVALARLADEPGQALTVVLVPLDAPGVDIVGFYPKVGTSACDLGHVVFDVELPPDAVLGRPGLGLAHVTRVLQMERLAVSAQLLVAARYCTRLAASFMRSREVAGGQKLIDMQAPRHKLAEVTADLWAAEAFAETIVAAMEAGRDVGHQTAALKLTCGQLATVCTDTALQLMGGRGYTSNYPIERIWRDVRLARIGAGTDEVIREIVAGALDRSDAEMDQVLAGLDASDLPVRREQRPRDVEGIHAS